MFQYPQKVLFKHCDPAGIVFYPRYFEMMNDCVEAFFDEVLGYSFEAMHPYNAIPTASITTRFRTPSRHGDQLILSLEVLRTGRSSAEFSITARCDSVVRFETTATVVHTENGHSSAWPEETRTLIQQQMKTKT